MSRMFSRLFYRQSFAGSTPYATLFATMADHSVFLLVEDNENDILLIRRAFSVAQVVNPLVLVRNGEEAMAYFMGIGAYKNRSEFPLPSLVLLDPHTRCQ